MSLGILLLLGLGCSPALRAGDTPAARGWLTVLHTNDIHGAYDLREATWLEERPLVGGFKALSGTVEAIRAEHEVILLDSGDLLTGDPLTTIDYDGVLGGGAIAFMNAVGYDAMAIGNHEFDNGRPTLAAMIEAAEFPMLAANLWIEQSGEPFAPGHTMIERGGYRVAVIGLVTDGLFAVTAAEPLRGLRLEPVVEAARREVAALDPRSDLIVVALHAGLGEAEQLATMVDGIDLILAGHDHRRTREPLLVNQTLIVEAGSSLTNLGRLDLRIENDAIAEHRFELLLLEGAAAAHATPAVSAVHERSHAAIQAKFGVQIATLERPFERAREVESNVGNWVTDVLREAAGADFALANAGGLRADLEAGPLTRLDIHRLMPFRNLLSTFRCTGEELRQIVELNVARSLGGRSSILQVSGLRYTFDDQGTIHELLVGGLPLTPDRVYTGATSDFVLFSQAERYIGFVPAERERTTLLLTDLLHDAAARQGRIDARVEGRVTRLASTVEAGEPVSASEQ